MENGKNAKNYFMIRNIMMSVFICNKILWELWQCQTKAEVEEVKCEQGQYILGSLYWKHVKGMNKLKGHFVYLCHWNRNSFTDGCINS